MNDATHPAAALTLTLLRERALTAELADAAATGDWTPHLPHVETLGWAHLERRILETLDTALHDTPAGQWADALTAVRHLHGLDVLIDTAAWHLNHGTLTPGDLDTLHRTRRDTVETVHHHMPTLVEWLAVPPGRVNAPCGQHDYVQRFAALLRSG